MHRNGLKTAVLLACSPRSSSLAGYLLGGTTGLVIGFVLALGDERLHLLQQRQARAALDARASR